MVKQSGNHIQWFPGHMAKGMRQIKEQLKIVDVVVELLDARIPMSSQNLAIPELIGTKPHIVALNKADLADPQITKAWQEYFSSKGISTILLNAVSGMGMKELSLEVDKLMAPDIAKRASKKMLPRSARVMIVGIPNVGKSSLLNRLCGKNRVETANRPGVTRAQKWIKTQGGFDLLDTPGILPPRLEDQEMARKLALTGGVKDDIYDMDLAVREFLEILRKSKPHALSERYKLTLEEVESLNTEELLDKIGRSRGLLISGNRVDLEKTGRVVIQEYRNGKLGKISLESPE